MVMMRFHVDEEGLLELHVTIFFLSAALFLISSVCAASPILKQLSKLSTLRTVLLILVREV